MQFAQRMDGITGSAIREIFALLARPGMISFAGGNPSPATFPAEDVAEITARLMAEAGGTVLQYGETAGWPALREQVLAFVQNKGVPASYEDLLILTGSTQGIELAAKIFLNPGDVVLCESPTFLGALQTFRTYKGVPVGVRSDDSGMCMDDLEEKLKATRAKLIYTIPTFQNPSGCTLPAARRARMVELAEKYGAVILEDDPYGDLRFAGEDQPKVRSFDPAGGTVIYLGSFSKIISPGLRVGFAVAAPEIRAKMIVAKQGIDTHTSNLSQAIVAEYMKAGKLPAHIRQCCEFYAAQLAAMAAAAEAHFPSSARFVRPLGGIFLWMTLPQGADVDALFARAVEHNVAFVPGKHFFPDLSGTNTLRLNYSMTDPATIEKGMQTLGGLVHELVGQ